jgi:hypothetical protein
MLFQGDKPLSPLQSPTEITNLLIGLDLCSTLYTFCIVGTNKINQRFKVITAVRLSMLVLVAVTPVEVPWRWNFHVHPKRWHLSTIPHGFTIVKLNIDRLTYFSLYVVKLHCWCLRLTFLSLELTPFIPPPSNLIIFFVAKHFFTLNGNNMVTI